MVNAGNSYTSFVPFKLVCPFLPTMWSCKEMPNRVAIWTIALVIWISACEGVGSPKAWGMAAA